MFSGRSLAHFSRRVLCSISSSSSLSSPPRLRINQEVQHALRDKRPVVALESTIISHGMPYPRNKEVALQVEETIRLAGCVPATIAVIDGICCIGLDRDQIEKIANPAHGKVLKASRRDLPYIYAKNLTAATTVASTMALADLVGIRVFCTGGIGGVHRGAEISFDVSADLHELARTPVVVVSAGIKSILDIPKTLEVLETLGVPVVTLNSSTFPSFFTNDSGIASPMVASDEREIALMMQSSRSLGLTSGMIVAVPNPNPADSMIIQVAIDNALAKASSLGIEGAKVTPFVLAEVERLTQGRSLEANITLVLNNAQVASKIAKSLVSISNNNNSSNCSGSSSSRWVFNTSMQLNQRTHNDVVVVGGSVIDIVSTASDNNIAKRGDYPGLIMKSSNPGASRRSVGGVGRNVATAVSRLYDGVNVCLLSVTAEDGSGAEIMNDLSKSGIDISRVKTINNSRYRSASYSAINSSNGDLCVAIADMDIFDQIDESYLASQFKSIPLPKAVVVDANISIRAFKKVGEYCKNNKIPLIFEPTSDHKCTLPLHDMSLVNGLSLISVLKPNFSELVAIVKKCVATGLLDGSRKDLAKVLIDDPNNSSCVDTANILAQHLLLAMNKNLDEDADYSNNKHVIVSLGREGCLWAAPKPLLASGYPDGKMLDSFIENYASLKFDSKAGPNSVIVNSNGAGDCLLAGIVRCIAKEETFVLKPEHISFGLHMSAESLQSDMSVPENFSIVVPPASSSF